VILVEAEKLPAEQHALLVGRRVLLERRIEVADLAAEADPRDVDLVCGVRRNDCRE
jgi:hypothetical protein